MAGQLTPGMWGTDRSMKTLLVELLQVNVCGMVEDGYCCAGFLEASLS